MWERCCGNASTVFARIEAWASIYLESTLDPASIRDRLYSRPAFIVLNRGVIKEIEKRLGAEYNSPVNLVNLTVNST